MNDKENYGLGKTEKVFSFRRGRDGEGAKYSVEVFHVDDEYYIASVELSNFSELVNAYKVISYETSGVVSLDNALGIAGVAEERNLLFHKPDESDNRVLKVDDPSDFFNSLCDRYLGPSSERFGHGAKTVFKGNDV